MNTTGLFEVKQRIEPALVKSYVVDVVIFKQTKSFFTRLEELWLGKMLRIYKVQTKKFLKPAKVEWLMTFNAFVSPKGKTLYSTACPFRSSMSFKFETNRISWKLL